MWILLSVKKFILKSDLLITLGSFACFVQFCRFFDSDITVFSAIVPFATLIIIKVVYAIPAHILKGARELLFSVLFTFLVCGIPLLTSKSFNSDMLVFLVVFFLICLVYSYTLTLFRSQYIEDYIDKNYIAEPAKLKSFLLGLQVIIVIFLLIVSKFTYDPMIMQVHLWNMIAAGILIAISRFENYYSLNSRYHIMADAIFCIPFIWFLFNIGGIYA